MQFRQITDPEGNIMTDKILLESGHPDAPIVVPEDPKNRHWQLYQEWLSEGNVPLPPA